jgi:hypothetical protein
VLRFAQMAEIPMPRGGLPFAIPDALEPDQTIPSCLRTAVAAVTKEGHETRCAGRERQRRCGLLGRLERARRSGRRSMGRHQMAGGHPPWRLIEIRRWKGRFQQPCQWRQKATAFGRWRRESDARPEFINALPRPFGRAVRATGRQKLWTFDRSLAVAHPSLLGRTDDAAIYGAGRTPSRPERSTVQLALRALHPPRTR